MFPEKQSRSPDVARVRRNFTATTYNVHHPNSSENDSGVNGGDGNRYRARRINVAATKLRFQISVHPRRVAVAAGALPDTVGE